MKIFRTTKKAFHAGRWNKRPKSLIRSTEPLEPSIDPEAALPGVRRNATTAPATGNRPDTVHTRRSAPTSKKDNTMGTYGMQKRKTVGGGIRTQRAYSRPQGETRNLSTPAPEPEAIAVVRDADLARSLRHVESDFAAYRARARADLDAAADEIAQLEARIQELEALHVPSNGASPTACAKA